MTSAPLPLIADFCTWNPRANSLVSLCSHIRMYSLIKSILSKNPSYIHRKLSTGLINMIGLFSFYFSSVLKSRLHLGMMREVKGLFLPYSPQMVFSPAYFPTISWFDFLLSSPSCHAGFFLTLNTSLYTCSFPFSSLHLPTRFIHAFPLHPISTHTLFPIFFFPCLCFSSIQLGKSCSSHLRKQFFTNNGSVSACVFIYMLEIATWLRATDYFFRE